VQVEPGRVAARRDARRLLEMGVAEGHLQEEAGVEGDLEEAHAWYEGKRPGLGDEILLAIEVAVESIRRRPRAFAVVERGLRRAVARRFPFSVFFVAGEEEVVVMYPARDPDAWREHR
jgi:hypothetical protein